LKVNLQQLSTLLVTLLISSTGLANSDSGRVTELYLHPDGQMAVKLDGGLPNSSKDTTCNTKKLEWAGVASTVDVSLKKALLSAKSDGATIILITKGRCIGNWIQIEELYIQ
jgi:hypothetical protein